VHGAGSLIAGHGIAAIDPLETAVSAQQVWAANAISVRDAFSVRQENTSGWRRRYRRTRKGLNFMSQRYPHGVAARRSFSKSLVGVAMLAGALVGQDALAQQSNQTKKGAPAAAAPAPKSAPAPQAQAQPGPPQSAWVKLCEKIPVTAKDKDGKELKQEKSVCLTHHERLDGNTGMVLVSAAVRQVEGVDKQHLMVMVPLGMMIQPGIRAAVYSKELWEKVQKNEKIEENKLKPMALGYTLCHPAGCTAETEATADLLKELKTGGGLMVFAVNAVSQPIAFPVPLNGFEEAYAGAPVDNQKYSEARRALMQQIAQRQQQLMAEYKKQNNELQKMQGTDAFGTNGTAPAQASAPTPSAQSAPAQNTPAKKQ
jgi:invasion protein IalB